MSDYIIATITTLLQNIMYLGTMLYLAGRTPKELLNFRFLLCFSIFNPLVYLIQRSDNEWLVAALFIVLFFYTLVIKINSNCTLSQSLIIATYGYIFVSISQLISLLLLSFLHLEMDLNNISDIRNMLTMALSLLLVILFCHFLPIKRLLTLIRNATYAIALLIIVSTIFIVIGAQLIEDYKTGLILPTFATLIVFFVIGLLIFTESIKDYKRKQALKAYDTYMPIVNQMIENIQKRQHLYNNQIQSLICLADNHDTEGLVNAIRQITEITRADNTTYAFLHMENRLLAGLLYCKVQEAAEQSKQLIVKVTSFSYQSDCSDFDIVDMAGILLDNALEATPANGTIYVTIGETDIRASIPAIKRSRSFILKIENPGPVVTDEFAHSIFTKHYTTKQNSEGHGLGLSILKSTIEKNNGTITLSNTYPEQDREPYFCIEISV